VIVFLHELVDKPWGAESACYWLRHYGYHAEMRVMDGVRTVRV
jgi:hypothetical protein